MNIVKKKNYLFGHISSLKGIGEKTSKYLKKKNISTINDLLWNFPYSYTDRSETAELDKLEVGKVLTIKVQVKKYNFPRIRNLPNKIKCKDNKGEVDLVFFNSREGYLRKVLPLNEWVVISGKIGFFKNRYQITNPDYITKISNIDYVKKIIPKYSLTEGINEKSYRKIVEQVLNNLPDLDEWHDQILLKKMNFLSWKDSMLEVHNKNKNKDLKSVYYRRLAYDEIFSHLLALSKNRKKIKKTKKKPKSFKKKISNQIINKLLFSLTESQKKVIAEIDSDLISKNRMFRIIQGDVGSGKTIVSLIAAANVVESGFQCALMAPTEILAKQHYIEAKKIFKDLNFNTEILTAKTDNKLKKSLIERLRKNKIDLIIGTHSLFQKKINFNNLGLIIIDEQHKFGVKQRIELAKKGGSDCDVLLMSATPIPRTMMLSIYGDMDISRITEKPLNRKKIITLSKPEEKINELWPFIKKQISNKNQIFWVCPLIDESKFLNYSSALKRFEYINKKFPKQTGLIYGSMKKEDKDKILQKFLDKKINILISTTVIEVGIDFPNANLIIIENANKFGLAQLHQLRGRVGRGKNQGTCVLLFKGNLSKNAIERIKILKSTDDGFLIADKDMKLRGYGDIIGFEQSGIKYFRIADPIHHSDLFNIAENEVKKIENKDSDIVKFNLLLKLFDRAEVINEVELS